MAKNITFKLNFSLLNFNAEESLSWLISKHKKILGSGFNSCVIKSSQENYNKYNNNKNRNFMQRPWK